MCATARSCVFSSVCVASLAGRQLHSAWRSSASWRPAVKENSLIELDFSQINVNSKTDVVLNLKMTLFDNGKRRYFKLKKTLQFSEMTLQ